MDLREYSGRGSIYHHLPLTHAYLSAPKDGYTAPSLPVEIPECNEKYECLEFGGEQCRQLFINDENFTYLNHGARGRTLKQSLDVSQAYQCYMDSQPLRAKDRELVPLMCHVIREMADYVKCDPRDIFLTTNTHYGVNTILQCLTFKPGDRIATLSVGYGGVNEAVSSVCEKTGAVHEVINIGEPPINDQQILKDVSEQLSDQIKLIIIDHIPYSVPYLMPLQELSRLCTEKGILVLVDGAQSLGHIELDIPSYGVDFYVTSCHKWFCNTRGSALTYVRRELQHLIHPLVVSWGQNKGFSVEFVFSGTMYYSQYIGLLSTIKFWKTIGQTRITEYCRNTLTAAVKLLTLKWKVQPYKTHSRIDMMALVTLPEKLNDTDWKQKVTNKALLITHWIYDEHKIEVEIVEVNSSLHVRLSCHIYNCSNDYEKLADAVLDLCEKRDVINN